VALVLGACAPAATPEVTAEAPEAKQFKIGMANFSQCCAYFIGMNNAVIDAAKAYPNVEIISTDANGDAAKLNSDIEDHRKEVDGVIISGLEQFLLPSIPEKPVYRVLVDRRGKGITPAMSVRKTSRSASRMANISLTGWEAKAPWSYSREARRIIPSA
jgi:hypothetical protein